jgi:hypothetical protein
MSRVQIITNTESKYWILKLTINIDRTLGRLQYNNGDMMLRSNQFFFFFLEKIIKLMLEFDVVTNNFIGLVFLFIFYYFILYLKLRIPIELSF